MEAARGGENKRTKGQTIQPRFQRAFPGVPHVKSTFTQAQAYYQR